jgi:2'-hydroxyisoflavone reductase
VRILVLGGTRFVGHAIATAAPAAGHRVTTFNRGVSGSDAPGVQAVRGDRYSARSLDALAQRGPWDAVIDTSGYIPRNVRDVARSLEGASGRYLFMSTVSVYADWPVRPLNDDAATLICPPDAGPDFGVDTEDGPTRYGYQKSGCEAAVAAVFGPERTTVLRPGVVLGPHEYVGRLPWWLRRMARGGPVLAPGSRTRTIQPMDVRDLAAFALLTVERGDTGSYNVCAPPDRTTFEDLLRACIRATRSDAELMWIPDAELLAHGVRQWSELPLWRTHPGVWQVDSSKARRIGLHSRPIEDTVASTWDWLSASGAADRNERAAEIGISPEKEARILGARAGGVN